MIVSRLQSVCREHLLREKILVVPSLAIGHQIADAVAYAGTPWVNLRMETIRTISDAVAGFDLVQRGLTVLFRAQARGSRSGGDHRRIRRRIESMGG